jgi:hypothetical protein
MRQLAPNFQRSNVRHFSLRFVVAQLRVLGGSVANTLSAGPSLQLPDVTCQYRSIYVYFINFVAVLSPRSALAFAVAALSLVRSQMW